ncbi:MAG: hypothetical protein Edafosvirus5_4 [Edafosvirus sp.]|uniref:Uncharacterized protein n=1 Tax=Edafosvirus sp. TaxID=2487765 RepID=A0A3G4ZT62_9VIRU|nr:MAG: hypothetical protein Edafosvirus5_4 [Edafosvirus sp.]
MGQVTTKSLSEYLRKDKSEDKICKSLKKYNIKSENKSDYPIIFKAVDKNKIKVVQKLLDMGYDINKQIGKDLPSRCEEKYKDETLLMRAINENKTEIATLLINDKKCNLEIKNRSGRTAFYYALAENNFILINLMLSREVNLNVQTKSGISYLILLVSKIENGRIMSLVDNTERDMSRIDKSYQTMKKEYDDLFKKLVSVSNLNAVDSYRMSVLSYLFSLTKRYFLNTTWKLQPVEYPPQDVLDTLYNKEYINTIINHHLDKNDITFLDHYYDDIGDRFFGRDGRWGTYDHSRRNEKLIAYLYNNNLMGKVKNVYKTKIFQCIDNDAFLSSQFKNEYYDPNIIGLIVDFVY